jgi:hypothetical protein
MMIAKINDSCQGFCAVCEIWTTGNIINGSTNVFVNDMPTSQLNSIVQSSCGHTGSLICATKNRVNSLPIGVMGSQFIGIFTGTVLTGSSNVRSL